MVICSYDTISVCHCLVQKTSAELGVQKKVKTHISELRTTGKDIIVLQLLQGNLQPPPVLRKADKHIW